MFQVIGRLHPALVHFPIALLLAALAAELLRAKKSGPSGPSEAGFFCLVLGALGALVAAGSGWLFAAFDPPGVPELLQLHRWSGVGCALASLTTAVSAWRWRRTAESSFAWPTRAGLVLTAVLVATTGCLGGEMVYGEGFALEPLRDSGKETEPVVELPSKWLRSSELEAAGAGSQTDAAASPAVALDPPAPPPAPASDVASATQARAVDFASQIHPLLERRCFSCHGDKKRPKGKLKLSDMRAVLARAPSEAVIHAGDSAASELYRRISLSADDEDVMPPEDGTLSAEEIALVRRWIDEGARVAASAAPAPQPVEEPAVAAAAPLLSEAERRVRDAALARLRARGAHAQRTDATSDWVEVDLGVASPSAGDAELALLAGLEPCLAELSLARCRVSDDGLAALARFPHIRRLRLEHTPVGAAGLAPLASLKELESLNLFQTQAGDAALGTLRGLESLARVYVGETRISAAALEELRRARPGLAIVDGTVPDLAPGPAPAAR